MRKLLFALSMVFAVSAGCSSVSRERVRSAGNVGPEVRGAVPVHPRRAKALAYLNQCMHVAATVAAEAAFADLAQSYSS